MVIEASSEHKGNAEHFNNLLELINNDEVVFMCHEYLYAQDLDNFNVKNFPSTAARRQLIIDCAAPGLVFVQELIQVCNTKLYYDLFYLLMRSLSSRAEMYSRQSTVSFEGVAERGLDDHVRNAVQHVRRLVREEALRRALSDS